MKKYVMYRQGDVLIERIGEIPNRKSTTETLLIRGEGRNHGHFIRGEQVEIYLSGDEEQQAKGSIVTHYLDVKEEATLDHLLIDSGQFTSEHETIKVPPGKYKVIRQREYNPYTRAIRMIRD